MAVVRSFMNLNEDCWLTGVFQCSVDWNVGQAFALLGDGIFGEDEGFLSFCPELPIGTGVVEADFIE